MARPRREDDFRDGERLPLFVGNFEYDARQRDVERLFERFGSLQRVDLKQGYAFVFMEDDRDAEDAIRALDGKEWGIRQRRRLKVERAHGEGDIRRRERERSDSGRIKPSDTLFVANVDRSTRDRDLERHFEPYGPIARAQVQRNFGFVQFERLEDAERAIEKAEGSHLNGREIHLEFTLKKRPMDGPPSDRKRSLSPPPARDYDRDRRRSRYDDENDDDYPRRYDDRERDRRARRRSRSRSPLSPVYEGASRRRSSPPRDFD